MTDLLARLVSVDTTLGNEEAGQIVVRDALREIGLVPVDVAMDAAALRSHPGHSPFDWDVDGKSNVVATWEPLDGAAGRSLILNGHIDVVSPEPRFAWTGDPFVPRVEDGWLVGRGSADMKGGLVAILGAIKGLRALGLRPHGPVHVESVVEEECTGNGTLQTLLAGYTADAAVIAEPFGAGITTSQVGVLWFRARIRGVPGHGAEADAGQNPIERSYGVIRALHLLEQELNANPPPPYDQYEHPIALNVGAIHAGDWASTVPGECLVDFRIALYPGMRVRDLQDRIEAAMAALVTPSAGPPEVEYRGFACEGYAIDPAHPLVTTLADAFARQSGGPPSLLATTGTTDARLFGLYGGVPAVCLGPLAEGAHGGEERTFLPSVVQTAQVLGTFVRTWCGLSFT